jgi:hypothetical protein
MGISTAIVTAAAQTGGGDQSFTKSGFGTHTNTLAFFFVTRDTAIGTVAADHAILGVGAADGSSQWCWVARAEHNVASSDCYRRGATDECIMVMNTNNTSIDGEAAFKEFISNGVTVTWGNNPAAGYLITCVLVGGTDFDVDVGVITATGAQDSDTSTTAPGFEPDVVAFSGMGTSFGDSSSNGPAVTIGFAENRATIKNRASTIHLNHGASAGSSYDRVEEDRCAQNVYLSSISRSIECTAFGANGFTVTKRDGSSDLAVGYVAMKFGNNDFWIGTVDTPTSTGNDAETGPGFKPQFVMQVCGNNTAVDLFANNGVFAVSVFNADDKYCLGISDEFNADTTVTQSLVDDQPVYIDDDDGTLIFDATFVSFDALGWTSYFGTTETGAAKKWIAFAIEEDAAVAGAPTLRRPLDNYLRNLVTR